MLWFLTGEQLSAACSQTHLDKGKVLQSLYSTFFIITSLTNFVKRFKKKQSIYFKKDVNSYHTPIRTKVNVDVLMLLFESVHERIQYRN